jgi:hypothetical protein
LVPRAFGDSRTFPQGRLPVLARPCGAGVLALGFAALLAAISAARAEDPPSRVGSLNYVSGQVSYALRGETGEPTASETLSWTEADFDQPVSEDMSLRTGEKARARIRIGADAIEMSDETVLNLLNLSGRLIEASVGQGRIYLQIDRLDPGESVEIEMRQGSLSLLAPGGYDIEVGSGDAPAHITVFDGKARFFGGNADAPVAAGEELQITGKYPAVTATAARSVAANSPPAATSVPGGPASAAPSTAFTVPAADGNEGGPAAAGPTPAAESPPAAAPAADGFMYFVAESKSDAAAAQSVRYVSPETTGYDDLDRYGHWETLPDAEAVWFPDSVPPDWAPYRFGHWDWIAPWGWTWVDDEPWGFAPFHYGRWIDLDGRWGWVPGPVVADPVYAPALVAFVDIGEEGPDPDVGWFPLAPGDAFVPWYAAGPAYVAGVNAGGAAGAGHGGGAGGAPYANRKFATAVPRSAFAGGRPVQQALARIPPDRLAQAAVLRGAPHVAAPQRPAARGETAGFGPSRPEANGRPGLSGAAPERGATPQRERAEANDRPGLSRAAPEHGAVPQRERAQPSRGVAEANRRGGQQFARPEGFRNATAANRGGATQFRQPEAFRTPMSSFAGRGFQTPQFGARSSPTHVGGGGTGSVSRHK